MRWASLLLLLLVACGPQVGLPDGWDPKGPYELKAEISTRKVGLMQPLTLTLWAYLEADAQPSSTDPAIPDGFVGDIDTVWVRHGDGFVVRRDLHLRPTRLGQVEIPSIPFRSGDHQSTFPAFEIEVASALGEEFDPREAENPAPPFPGQFRWQPWALWALGAGLLVLLSVLWLRRPRKATPLPVEVPLPPHVRALRELERLRRVPRVTETEIESFYVGVSKVLRDYLEGRFGLHAPLRSTEEFLVEVERGDQLSLAHRQSLRTFLGQCDLVKFAHLMPEDSVHEQTLGIAEVFVEQTREDRVEEGAA